MNARTEIVNFAAASWALAMTDDHPERDAVTRNLADYGPALHDPEYMLPGETEDEYFGRMETRADRAAWYDMDR